MTSTSARVFTFGVLTSADAFVTPDLVAMNYSVAAINADATILAGHELQLDVRAHTTQGELWANALSLIPSSGNIGIVGAYLSSDTLKVC